MVVVPVDTLMQLQRIYLRERQPWLLEQVELQVPQQNHQLAIITVVKETQVDLIHIME